MIDAEVPKIRPGSRTQRCISGSQIQTPQQIFRRKSPSHASSNFLAKIGRFRKPRRRLLQIHRTSLRVPPRMAVSCFQAPPPKLAGFCFFFFNTHQNGVPSLPLTWHLKEGPSKKSLIFQVPSHRCHVSWREGQGSTSWLPQDRLKRRGSPLGGNEPPLGLSLPWGSQKVEPWGGEMGHLTKTF